MHSLAIATLLPLAQAVEGGPQPGEVAGRVFKGMFSGENVFLVLLGIVLAIVIQILAYWISAKVVVGHKNGSVANAFKIWLLYFVVGIALGLLLVLTIPKLLIANNDAAVFAVMLGASVLGLALVFLLPMKVFTIGFGRSLLFLVLAWILMLAAEAGIHRAQGQPAFGGLPATIATLRSPEKRRELIEHLVGSVKPTGLDADLDQLALAEERAKSFPDRQEDLRKVYDQLEARQKALPPGDAKAVTEYERLRAKYEELVRVMKADYAASKEKSPAP